LQVKLTLERSTALFTMHELLVALADSPFKRHIVVEPKLTTVNSLQDHVIKIKSNLDENTHKIIEPIVKKRNLKIEKLEDAFIIY
jgi:hypothetical protein